MDLVCSRCGQIVESAAGGPAPTSICPLCKKGYLRDPLRTPADETRGARILVRVVAGIVAVLAIAGGIAFWKRELLLERWRGLSEPAQRRHQTTGGIVLRFPPGWRHVRHEAHTQLEVDYYDGLPRHEDHLGRVRRHTAMFFRGELRSTATAQLNLTTHVYDSDKARREVAADLRQFVHEALKGQDGRPRTRWDRRDPDGCQRTDVPRRGSWSCEGTVKGRSIHTLVWPTPDGFQVLRVSAAAGDPVFAQLADIIAEVTPP